MEFPDGIKNLKCSVCSNFLSYFPIHSSFQNRNICGRCPVPPNENFIRNTIYELIAPKIPFPCRYANEGCCKTSSPSLIPQHENSCPFKTSRCPTQSFTGCAINVSSSNILTHCRNDHDKVFLSNGDFQISLFKSQQLCNLLQFNEEVFVVKRRFKLENSMFHISVMPLGNHPTALPYKVRLTYGGAKLTIKGTTKEAPREISLISLKNQSGNFGEVVGKIILTKRTTISGGLKI